MNKLFNTNENVGVRHYSAEEFVTLYNTSSVVSMESIGDFFHSVRDKLNTLSSSLLSNTDTALVDALANQYEVKNVLKRVHFSDLAHENVVIPERFEGQYTAYLKTLTDSSKVIVPDTEQLINNLKMAVSSFINEYSEDGVLTVYGKKYAKETSKTIETHRQKVAAFFPIKKSNAVAKVKDVVRSNGDIETLFLSVRQLEGHINLNKLKNISKIAKELSEMVDSLIDLNSRSGILLKNTDAKKDLVEMIHIGAIAVEFSGYLYSNSVYLYNALGSLSEKILKVGGK